MKPTLPEDREIDGEGAEVSRRYREAAGEEPSARIDAAILAAARREARRPAVVRNWRTPAAIAAVLVIGVSVSLLTREGIDPLPPLEQSRGQADVARPAPPALAMKSEPAPKARLDPRSRPSRDRSERANREVEMRPGEKARSAGEVQSPVPVAPAGTAQGPSLQESPPDTLPSAESGATKPAEEKSLAEGFSPQGSMQEKKALADAQQEGRAQAERLRKEEPVAAAAPAVRQPPEQWLRSIEDLLRNGRPADARLQLTEFRKRYPDYRLPDALQAFEREAAPATK